MEKNSLREYQCFWGQTSCESLELPDTFYNETVCKKERKQENQMDSWRKDPNRFRIA